MKLSSEYKAIINETCFDPILVTDTELFVDPFSVFDEDDGFFAGSFDKIIRFFNEAFKLAAESPERTGVLYEKLKSMMTFPEVNEIGLGYSNSNNGSGTSKWFRDKIIDSLYKSIARGMDSYRHFEEIAIFEKGIGCDRISDITCNILKEEIISYTQTICARLNIPMVKVRMSHIRFDFKYLRWVDGYVNLPYNKYKNRGILLVPERFLNDLPTINPDGFRDYIWENKNKELRNDLNYSIKSEIDRDAVINIARRYPNWVEEYEGFKETQGFKAYNLKNDKKGVYVWAGKELVEYVKSYPFSFSDENTFFNCVLNICGSFKNFLETEKGYTLLWDDENNKPKPESALQTLFLGFIKAYGLFLNIDITRESNAGSGPVDFKCSQGYNKRVLIETKLVSNSKYWSGLERQLPKYMQAEEVDKGIFMLVAFSADEYNKANERIAKIHGLTLSYDVNTILIDASTGKPSASKL